jgi:HK97 family phage prohead protease
MKADFSGWATKFNVRCSDGRTIMPDAFVHQHGMRVPLVWQHGHDDPENVLGHVLLTAKPEGVWADAFFNKTPKAQHQKECVQHKDITMMSIWANKLKEKAKQVYHGAIREVSLVMAGANPEAKIINVTISHSDDPTDVTILDDEAIIHTGIPLVLDHEVEFDEEGSQKEEAKHADGDGGENGTGEKTPQEIYDSMTPEQQELVHALVGAAELENEGGAAAQSDMQDDQDPEGKKVVTHNAFEKGKKGAGTGTLSHDELVHSLNEGELTHDEFRASEMGEELAQLLHDARESGARSIKHVIQKFVLAHGITNISTLFPEATDVNGGPPQWITRRMEWVEPFLNATSKRPTGFIKTRTADLTFEQARARGYIKGTLKKEQFFEISQRETTPKTVYKKQKFDRDDIIDVEDFDLIAWIKPEMHFMLREEIARAALVGDGRAFDDEDKIDEDKIRPIASDDEFYTTQIYVNVSDSNSSMHEVVDSVIMNRSKLKGSGSPTFYTTEYWIARFLTTRNPDTDERMFKSVSDIAVELRVREVVAVEVLEDSPTIVGIMVNPVDYCFGMARKGQITDYEDFDIDYNQEKFLTETRLCGALIQYKSAMVINSVPSGAALTVPNDPTFDEETGVVTIVATTGVVYKDGDGNTLSTGAQAALDPGETMVVEAFPASASYYFSDSDADDWSFTRPE